MTATVKAECFVDNVNTFGIDWAFKHYVKKGKMDEKQFWFWVASCADELIIG